MIGKLAFEGARLVNCRLHLLQVVCCNCELLVDLDLSCTVLIKAEAKHLRCCQEKGTRKLIKAACRDVLGFLHQLSVSDSLQNSHLLSVPQSAVTFLGDADHLLLFLVEVNSADF